MSSVDAAWLGMEDPTNLMMVTGVLALDGKVDIKRLRTLLDKRLAPFGRFHQRVARPRMRGGMLHWQDDSQFDIDNHVSHIALPPPGGEKALRELVSELMSTPAGHDQAAVARAPGRRIRPRIGRPRSHPPLDRGWNRARPPDA